MDFIDRLAHLGSGRQRTTFANGPSPILKFTNLHPQVQKHLSKVYLTLCACLALVSAGCWLGLQFPVILPVTQLAAFGCMVVLGFMMDTPTNLKRRQQLLAAFSFCQGCSLTPLVGLASAVYPGVVMAAVMSTSAIFLCFTGAALLTPRRSYLFLGGTLSSMVAAMGMLRLAAWMFRAPVMALSVELYVGLLLFAAYILYDTQLIVEKAYSGSMDHVRHAMDLLVDLIALFARVLMLLMKNAQKKAEEQEKKAHAKHSRR